MNRRSPARLAASLMLVWLPAAFAAEASPQFAAVSGIWTGTMTDRNGDPQDLSFRFTQNGNAVQGKMYGDNESLPVTGIRITGNEITFSVTTELNGQITTFIYNGVVAGSEMEVSRTRQDVKPPDKAPKAEASPNKPNPPQTFRLKRLT